MEQDKLERARAVMIEVIREIAELDNDVPISDEQDLNKDLGVDSLTGVDLAIALERELNIFMPEDELSKINTVGDLYSLITKSITANQVP